MGAQRGTSLCFGGSAQKIRELGQWKFRPEGSGRVTLGTIRPRNRVLTRQFFEPLFPVLDASQRRHEGDQVVDISLRQSKRLDVLIKERVMDAVALVVVIDD